MNKIMKTILLSARSLVFAAAILLAVGSTAAFAQPGSQTTPQTFNEFVQAGQESARKADYAGAARWYSKALEVRPDLEIMYARGASYMGQAKWDEALKDFNAIVKARPDSVPGLYMRAVCYNAKTNWKKGLVDAEAVLKLDAEHADAYQTRGLAKAGLGRYAEAEADLAEAIRRNPRNPMYFTVRAAIYTDQGKAALAQADKLKAEQLKGAQ